MDLRLLRSFVAVAEAGTVTDAAHRLRLGQPAVSRQLQQLERRLRLALFTRDEGRLRLTAAGEHLLPEVRALIEQADRVEATARGLADGQLRAVRIVSTSTTRDDVLAPWLATWAADAPLPSIAEEPVDGVYGALGRGADLAVSPKAPPRGLPSRLVARLPLWAQVAPGHPWAALGSVGLADLAAADLLLLPPEFYARRVLDGALDRAGLSVVPVGELGSPVAAQAVAATGRGVCVVTDDPRFDLVPLRVISPDGSVLGIRLHAAWPASHHAAAALAGLAESCADFVGHRYGESAPPS